MSVVIGSEKEFQSLIDTIYALLLAAQTSQDLCMYSDEENIIIYQSEVHYDVFSLLSRMS